MTILETHSLSRAQLRRMLRQRRKALGTAAQHLAARAAILATWVWLADS